MDHVCAVGVLRLTCLRCLPLLEATTAMLRQTAGHDQTNDRLRLMLKYQKQTRNRTPVQTRVSYNVVSQT